MVSVTGGVVVVVVLVVDAGGGDQWVGVGTETKTNRSAQ